MKNIWVLLSLVTLLHVNAQTSLFDEANVLYQEEKYEQAEILYDSLLSTGLVSAELYYNLGNAQYKNGKIAPCILSYERALQLAPNDGDIAYNLELVQQHVVDELEEVDVFFLKKMMQNWRRSQSSDFWAMGSLLFFMVFIFCFITFFLSHRAGLKRLSFYLGTLTLIISLTVWSFSRHNKIDITSHKEAIVLVPTITVTSSPNESGTKIFVLHEGAKVGITDQLNDWVEIRLSDGHKGWVKAETIEAI